MRVYVVVENTLFFVPRFVGEFLARTPDTVVGAAVVNKIKPQNGIFHYARRHLWHFAFAEFVRLAVMSLGMRFRALVARPARTGPYASVRQAFRAFGVPQITVDYDINQSGYIDAIAATRPDIVLNLSPLIFGERMLSVPAMACLNRHSSLLPAYGGHWPVFQALRAGERFVGVTVHVMDRGIDSGSLLVQHRVPVTESDTVTSLYERCFAISADATLEALERIRTVGLAPISTNETPSYYSFPTDADWKQFRDRGRRIC